MVGCYRTADAELGRWHLRMSSEFLLFRSILVAFDFHDEAVQADFEVADTGADSVLGGTGEGWLG